MSGREDRAQDQVFGPPRMRRALRIELRAVAEHHVDSIIFGDVRRLQRPASGFKMLSTVLHRCWYRSVCARSRSDGERWSPLKLRRSSRLGHLSVFHLRATSPMRRILRYPPRVVTDDVVRIWSTELTTRPSRSSA